MVSHDGKAMAQLEIQKLVEKCLLPSSPPLQQI